MGARFPSVVSTTFVGPLPANATETVVIVSPPFSPSIDSSVVMIQWFFSYQAGVANNFAQYRLRRGTTAASTLLNVGTWAFTTAAGRYVYRFRRVCRSVCGTRWAAVRLDSDSGQCDRAGHVP